MSIPARVEIVPARHKGTRGYANVGRGTRFGNPFEVNEARTPAVAVEEYRALFHAEGLGGAWLRRLAFGLLWRSWDDGVIRIACPCNGATKTPPEPCHATVIKEYVEAVIAERAER